MIRIGSSCAITKQMALGKVIETRRYLNVEVDWIGVAKQAIATKQYLIVTLCINHNNSDYTYPSDYDWIVAVDDTCKKLKSYQANRYNCRISLVNEPMKYISREQYAHLIHLAYPIIKGHGFLCGAGNEEFLTAQAKGFMYEYILQNCMFDILDIHIQGSCDTPEKTEYWCNVASQWATQYGRQIDCTEAFYSDIRTSKGWALLQSQLYHAERIGCPNFCNVFNNLVRSAFPTLNTTGWDKLCFNIDGVNQSGYWLTWKSLMESKAPIPNIIEERISDGMILPSTRLILTGYLTELVEELLIYLGHDVSSIDGKFTQSDVDALKEFQTSDKPNYPNIVVDGVCGRKGYYYLINEISDSAERKKFEFKLNVYASPVK